MLRTASINIRPDDKSLYPFLNDLVKFLDGRGIKIILPPYDILKESSLSALCVPLERHLTDADLVIAVGGDGTFLRTARFFADTDKPIFGINRGRVGFLTEFSPEEAFSHLDGVIQGKARIVSRQMLEAVHLRRGTELDRAIFLNDAVISKGAFSRPILIELAIDGNFLNNYSGDGLIIATTTGSTAYSLSAGGPIIAPPVDGVYIINPICPHVLAVRPMIVSSSCVLRARIMSHFENLLLTIDGQVAIHIEFEDEIIFQGAGKKINLITHPDYSFYDILRQKLGWGRGDGRENC